MFTADLAKFRNTSKTKVRSNYGQGRMFGADEAIERGMADRKDTLENTISRLATRKRASGRQRRTEAVRHRMRIATW